jgi:hypothetical protein
MDNPEILLPPPDEIIIEFLNSIPQVLRYQSEQGLATDFEQGLATEFKQFTELPEDIQNKILREYPTRSMIGINKELTLRAEESYYNNYCMNQSITRQEMVNYFNSMNYGDSISFELFRLYGFIDPQRINIEQDQFQLVVIEETEQPYHLVAYDFFNDEAEDIGQFNNGDEIVDFFTQGRKMYIMLFDNLTTSDIISYRLSCNKHNYPNDYVKHVNKEFLTYFAPYPFIAKSYLDFVMLETSPNFTDFITKIVEVSQEEDTYFITVDLKTQFDLIEYYNKLLQ